MYLNFEILFVMIFYLKKDYIAIYYISDIEN